MREFFFEHHSKRGIIEHTINRLERSRRVATRYDKLASSCVAMVANATILEWL